MTIALWILQVLLAALFTFAGAVKLMMPIEELTAQIAVPGWFIRFISVAEILGALGLILPGLLRIRAELTPLAAAGLTIIMVGAVVTTAMTMDAVFALMPLVVGILAVLVAYARWRVKPLRKRAGAAIPAVG